MRKNKIVKYLRFSGWAGVIGILLYAASFWELFLFPSDMPKAELASDLGLVLGFATLILSVFFFLVVQLAERFPITAGIVMLPPGIIAVMDICALIAKSRFYWESAGSIFTSLFILAALFSLWLGIKDRRKTAIERGYPALIIFAALFCIGILSILSWKSIILLKKKNLPFDSEHYSSKQGIEEGSQRKETLSVSGLALESGNYVDFKVTNLDHLIGGVNPNINSIAWNGEQWFLGGGYFRQVNLIRLNLEKNEAQNFGPVISEKSYKGAEIYWDGEEKMWVFVCEKKDGGKKGYFIYRNGSFKFLGSEASVKVPVGRSKATTGTEALEEKGLKKKFLYHLSEVAEIWRLDPRHYYHSDPEVLCCSKSSCLCAVDDRIVLINEKGWVDLTKNMPGFRPGKGEVWWNGEYWLLFDSKTYRLDPGYFLKEGLTLPEGTAFSTSQIEDLYWYYNDKKHIIPNGDVLRENGFSWEDVVNINKEIFDAIPSGKPLGIFGLVDEPIIPEFQYIVFKSGQVRFSDFPNRRQTKVINEDLLDSNLSTGEVVASRNKSKVLFQYLGKEEDLGATSYSPKFGVKLLAFPQRKVRVVLRSGKKETAKLAFSPRAEYISWLEVSNNHYVILDSSTNKELRRIKREEANRMSGIYWVGNNYISYVVDGRLIKEDIQGTEIEELSDDVWQDNDGSVLLSWSNDGSWLTYQNQAGNLVVMNAEDDGKFVAAIAYYRKSQGENYVVMGWDEEDSCLYFSHVQNGRKIFRVDLKKKDKESLYSLDAIDASRLSPDGKYLFAKKPGGSIGFYHFDKEKFISCSDSFSKRRNRSFFLISQFSDQSSRIWGDGRYLFLRDVDNGFNYYFVLDPLSCEVDFLDYLHDADTVVFIKPD